MLIKACQISETDICISEKTLGGLSFKVYLLEGLISKIVIVPSIYFVRYVIVKDIITLFGLLVYRNCYKLNSISTDK